MTATVASTLASTLECSARLVTELPAPVALFDCDLRYVAASAAWIDAFQLDDLSLTGRRHDEICGVGLAALEQAQRRALAGEGVDDCAVGGEITSAPRSASLSAQRYRDGDGRVAGVVVALRTGEAPQARDVSAPLSGRHELTRSLRHALAGRLPAAPPLLVIAISLDNLRRIANQHGDEIGDQVDRIVDNRLRWATRTRPAGEEGAGTRGQDMVARFGAGKFGVLCVTAPSPADAERLAARLLRLVQSPIAIGGRSLQVAASLGFVLTGAARRDADAVLRDVDLALQQAQDLGPGRAVAWGTSLTGGSTRHDTLPEALAQAFANGEFTLHYQPVLRLNDSRMVGAEALLRWNHPSEGLAPSAAFVPVLEETGLIVEVGCWVVREVVRQLESWRMLYGRDIIEWISVNLSPRQLGDPAPLLATIRAIHDGGFAVHRVKLEGTEGALMNRPDVARAALIELRELGLGFAIDDFGSGCASLDRPPLFPVEAIKIDAGLVAQIGTAEGDRSIGALLDIARLQGAAVIAEGIETAAQRDFLRSIGCGFGQGYLLAQPMDGALLGAYALTHSVDAARGVRRPRPAALSPRTSAGRSPAR